MNTLCSQIISSCLLLVLLFLLYCAIRLDKFQDYHDALAQSLKCFRQLPADLEKRLSSKDQASKQSAQSAEITVIDLQIHRDLEEALSNQDARRKFSIRINPTFNSLKRKNSIDYTIQINSHSDPNSNSDPNDESPSLHENLQLESNYQNQSNDHLSPCLRTSLQVNTILPKCRVHETVKEPIRSGDRHSSDYLKTYMEYERRSRNELVSMKNARSSQNMQKRVSFTDLCEMNGVKTIRDLIKEKQRQRNWLKQEEKRENFNYIKTRQIDG